jgi:hypothetical protein
MPKFASGYKITQLIKQAHDNGISPEKVKEIVDQHKHHGIIMDRDVPALRRALEKAGAFTDNDLCEQCMEEKWQI